MIGVIALNAGDGKIPSAVMLALPWQAEVVPCVLHAASSSSITSSGKTMQDFESFYTLLLLAGFFLLLSLCTIQIALLHGCKTLFSVNGSLSSCLQ